jgi:alkanesulfonate monooxygenase SsuD/methylene tetrahydromethanopterin reductase-like flavin-dependent oxidoreductase (luciferase family)
MRYGIFVPNLGPFADPSLVRDLAVESEACGWDGFFLWDQMLFSTDTVFPAADPWVQLAAVAAATSRITLGALVTPLARRRPWKVARETVTLDHLARGRLIFGAGLGAPVDADFGRFGEEQSDRGRARKLDEALEVLELLWSGEQVEFHGDEFDIGPVTFLPRPVQQPRIPVWIAGWWPNRPPFRRAARWDGVAPELVGGAIPSPSDIAAIARYVDEHRPEASKSSGSPFDIVINGSDCWAKAATLAEYATAGLTWWLERVGPERSFTAEAARELIHRGPPR